jgi:hypothetical protein
MATLDSSIEELGTAWKVLHRHWGNTQSLWSDSVSQHFEKRYLALFEVQTQAMLKEMQGLAQVIAEAQRRVR